MRTRLWIAFAMTGSMVAREARAVEVIPIVGFGKPTGKGSDSFNNGLHAGISLGGRVSERVSLHGQFHAHLLSFADVPSSVDVSGTLIMLTFAPLFHLLDPDANADLVIGPTIGAFRLADSASQGGESASASVHGYHIGVAMAAFFPISPTMSLGPYAQYTRLWATEACHTLPGESERCDSSPSNSGDPGFYSLGAAASF